MATYGKWRFLLYTLRSLGFLILLIFWLTILDNVIRSIQAEGIPWGKNAGFWVDVLGLLSPAAIFPLTIWMKIIFKNPAIQRVFKIMRKPNLVILYMSVNKKWAVWIKQQLELRGYTASLRAWNEMENIGDILQKCLKRNGKTISIVCSRYLSEIEKNAAGFESFKRSALEHRHCLFSTRQKVSSCLLGYGLDVTRYTSDIEEEEIIASLSEHLDILDDSSGVNSSNGQTEERVPFPGKLPPIWNIPEPCPKFTGREEQLEEIYRAALSQERKIALYSIPGMGKREIARQYAYRNCDLYSYGFFVGASNPDDDLLEIKQLLAKQAENDPQITDLLSLSNSRTMLKNWLKDHENWLLVLEGCEERDLLEQILPDHIRGLVLYTTDTRMTGGAYAIKVHAMNKKEGGALLLRYTHNKDKLNRVPDQEREMAETISELLGGIPQAIDLAGNFIFETGSRLVEYKNLYSRERADLFNKYNKILGEKGGEVRVIIYTWFISFQKISQVRPEAEEFLRFCTRFDPKGIPGEVLESWYIDVFKGGAEFNEVLAPLLNYSLISRESIKAGNPETIIVMNPHVHDILPYVRSILKEDATASQHCTPEIALSIVGKLFPEVNVNTLAQAFYFALQTKKLLKDFPRLKLITPEIARLYGHYGSYLREIAEYAEAEKYLKKGLWLTSKLEPKNSTQKIALAYICSNLAKLYSDQGQNKKAEGLLKKALESYSQLPRKYAYKILEPQYRLATILYSSGKDANKLFNAIHDKCKQLLSSPPAAPIDSLEHIQILKYLGLVCIQRQQYREANQCFEKGLDLCKEVERQYQHSPTEKALCQLGLAQSYVYLYNAEGRFSLNKKDYYDLAEKFYVTVLEAFIDVFGKKHPQVALILLELGNLYRNRRGYHRYARSCYKQAREIYQEKLPEHSQIIKIEKALSDLSIFKLGRKA